MGRYPSTDGIAAGRRQQTLKVSDVIGPTPGIVHQQLTDRIRIRQPFDLFIQAGQFRALDIAKTQLRRDGDFKHGIAVNKLAHPGLEGGLRHLAHLQTEAAQDAANRLLDSLQRFLDRLASRQYRAMLL